MIATNSKSIYDKIWTLKDIGKNRNKYQKIDKNIIASLMFMII